MSSPAFGSGHHGRRKASGRPGGYRAPRGETGGRRVEVRWHRRRGTSPVAMSAELWSYVPPLVPPEGPDFTGAGRPPTKPFPFGYVGSEFEHPDVRSPDVTS
ncbi:hypothetical protein [Candidatus Neomicrothrix sp.]|uniref:hypothetical protein n=1 Tax=Candidatus Neomicrothrix sp. TaxID=2719034 RepID=UPI0025C2A249|nr:hypothetical protein [Candidatus Microthrix sp.]